MNRGRHSLGPRHGGIQPAHCTEKHTVMTFM